MRVALGVFRIDADGSEQVLDAAGAGCGRVSKSLIRMGSFIIAPTIMRPFSDE